MTISFKATLFVYPGKGGWTFARVPKAFSPVVTLRWGRTPVQAVLRDVAWNTSVWTDKHGDTLLPIPKKVRGKLGAGDDVDISLSYRM